MLGISSLCKAEEGGVAVATSTDDNAADGDINSTVWLIMKWYTTLVSGKEALTRILASSHLDDEDAYFLWLSM